MRVLVTGATGFLGAEIVRYLLKQPWQSVVALARTEQKADRLRCWCAHDAQHMEILLDDILTLESLPPAVDAVVHAAAVRQVPTASSAAAGELFETNLAGTCQLLKLAVKGGVRRFIYVSSQSVYGHDSAPWTEESPVDPQTAYAISKYAGELLVRCLPDAMDWAVLRLSRLYGVSLFTRWGEIVARFCEMVYHGEPIPLHGDGEQRVDLLHVADAAACVDRLLKIHPQGWSDTYNVGAGASVSLNQLLAALADVAAEMHLPGPVVERRPDIAPTGPAHLELDVTRARTKLGWAPRRTLLDGLRELLQAVE
jgi:dTDP-glucose 4,6-dehydratase